MVNRALYSLTNMASGFSSPIFPQVPVYTPTVCPIDVEVVRATLMANSPQDFYRLGLLAALDAFPNIRSTIGEDRRTYDLVDYRPADAQASGFTWLPSPTGPAGIQLRASTFPVSFLISLTYKLPNVMTINYGKQTWDINVLVSNGIVTPAWPPELGITGLMGSFAWAPGFVGFISLTPASFPYPPLCLSLEATSEHWDVMLRMGMLEMYYAARAPEEKIAWTCAAICKATNP